MKATVFIGWPDAPHLTKKFIRDTYRHIPWYHKLARVLGWPTAFVSKSKK